MDSPYTREAEQLAQLLSAAEHALTRRLATVLEQEGCTVERWRALTLLADGESRAMSEIADFALLPAPSLTRLIDRMVADNLLYRKADPCDRRRVLVRITSCGKDFQARLARRVEQDEVLGDLGGDVPQLAELLSAMLRRLRG